MSNIFSYDSKLVQALMYVGDMIILNVLFLLCCLPIFTIGAAQTGLYSGIRVLLDKEDDQSCATAFFKGFANGFGKITVIWLFFFVLFAFLLVNLVPFLATVEGVPEFLSAYADIPHASPVITIIGLFICAILYNWIVLFHTRCNCTIPQLFRNSVLMFLAHPIRSILATTAVWLPFWALLYSIYLFMQVTPLFLTVGFCGIFMMSFGLTNKPFKPLLEAKLAEEHAIDQEQSQAPEQPSEEAAPQDVP